MNLLFRIVYAAHASGTHHKLALDALRNLKPPDADQWQRLFLAHAKLYLEGSKAPDTQFKDFKNHVLHTRDGYWGGAPEKARSWYRQLVEALSQQNWPTAVHCAGVLSHYYTDPLQPFHTAQSEAENNIHRAVEWSISKAYDELALQGEREWGDMRIELPPGPNWLAELVCQGAELANRYYEKLIAHYDIRRGVVDPPAGLDSVARGFIAELIRYATLSYAAVLDRAIEEANVHAPSVPLAAVTLAAIGQVPIKMIVRRIADAQERRCVEQMYDELLATGTVEANLPADDRLVRDLHAAEVLAKRPPQPVVSKVFPFKVSDRAGVRDTGEVSGGSNVVPMHASPLPATPRPAPKRMETGADAEAATVIASRVSARSLLDETAREDEAPTEPAPDRPRVSSGLLEQLDRLTVTPLARREPGSDARSAPAAAAQQHFHLTLDHDVVDGPTIGPKTAERLYPHGIKTVRDLIKAEPAALAVLLNNRHIIPETIIDWQDQARLVCTVPELRGTHAQLLVGAGYRSAEAIASADADKLCADVLAFAVSANGQRLLRNGDPPDIEKIKGWLEAAQSVKAA